MDVGRTRSLLPRADHDRVAELDGLRAVAVVPVIALHFGAAINGGAGVTVFFALSGYLITTLLMTEHTDRGRIDLRRFYLRRFRRLLPAATMVVIATVVVGRALDKPSIVRDAVASLTYWANFARYTSHYSYGHTAYAPLEHFWSLAIEEQFYVVLPVLCIVLLRLGRRVLGTVAGVAMIGSAAFAFVHRGNPQMYFHSFARVGELLAGVVLAVVLPRVMRWAGDAGQTVAKVAAHVALVALLVVFARVVTPQPIFVALLACVVIVGRPRVLALRPLVIIGTYSYGLYLWHPLTELLSDHVVVRLALTIAITFASFHLVEFPVRRHLSAHRALTAMAALSIVALVVVALPQPSAPIRFLPTAPVVAASPVAEPSGVATAVPSASAPAPASTPASAPASTQPDRTERPATGAPTTVVEVPPPTELQATEPPASEPPASEPATSAPATTAPPQPRPVRVSAAGDSTQMFADAAWQAFAAAYPDTVTWVMPPADIVPWTSGADGWGGQQAADLGLALPFDGPQGGLDRQGCPLIYDLPVRAVDTFAFEDSAKLHSATPTSSCDWHLWMPAALAAMHLDVLVTSWAVTGMWEYELPDGRHASVGDDEFNALLDQRMAEFEAMAAQYGTRVVWTTYQPISKDGRPDRWTQPETADLLAAVMLKRPCVSDLRTVVRADPTFAWYQDGYHFTPEGAARAVAAIVPDVVSCAAREAVPGATNAS